MESLFKTYAIAACFAFQPLAAEATCSDVAIVLAVDGSSSIRDEEYALQLSGYAAAFTDPAVVATLTKAGTVDVAMLFWADSVLAAQTIPWRRIRTSQDAADFADSILSTRRAVFGDTDIGDGLWASLDLLSQPGRCANRTLINLSGDGAASVNPNRRKEKVSLSAARRRAERLGVTVNGLAIVDEEQDLPAYYRNNLITGADSFVMSVRGFEEFGEAIKRKLIREIGTTLTASLDPPRPSGS